MIRATQGAAASRAGSATNVVTVTNGTAGIEATLLTANGAPTALPEEIMRFAQALAAVRAGQLAAPAVTTPEDSPATSPGARQASTSPPVLFHPGPAMFNAPSWLRFHPEVVQPPEGVPVSTANESRMPQSRRAAATPSLAVFGAPRWLKFPSVTPSGSVMPTPAKAGDVGPARLPESQSPRDSISTPVAAPDMLATMPLLPPAAAFPIERGGDSAMTSVGGRAGATRRAANPTLVPVMGADLPVPVAINPLPMPLLPDISGRMPVQSGTTFVSGPASPRSEVPGRAAADAGVALASDLAAPLQDISARVSEDTGVALASDLAAPLQDIAARVSEDTGVALSSDLAAPLQDIAARVSVDTGAACASDLPALLQDIAARGPLDKGAALAAGPMLPAGRTRTPLPTTGSVGQAVDPDSHPGSHETRSVPPESQPMAPVATGSLSTPDTEVAAMALPDLDSPDADLMVPPSPVADSSPRGAAAAAGGSPTTDAASGSRSSADSAPVAAFGPAPADRALPSEVRSIPVDVAAPHWPKAVAAELVMLGHQKVESATLRVSPEHLGQIEVHIHLDAKVINLTFGAAHAETRSALEHALPQLRDGFAQAGLTLGQATVQQQMRQESQNDTVVRRTQSDAVDEVITKSEHRQALSLVDEYA
jgi:flagellar hook-length control protein FliK